MAIRLIWKFLVTDRYVPEYPSERTAEWAYRELQRIGDSLDQKDLWQMELSYVEPTKPRDGDVRYADGTYWDPGSGKGLYLYKTNTWTLLG
jgi:hypothetical protein